MPYYLEIKRKLENYEKYKFDLRTFHELPKHLDGDCACIANGTYVPFTTHTVLTLQNTIKCSRKQTLTTILLA